LRGFCENCERGQTGFCLIANPGNAGAAYGYVNMGPYNGGQAELLRVPFADFICLVLPPDAQEKEPDRTGKAKPSFIISDGLPLAKAAEGYANFNARKDGWTKVVLKTGA